MNDFDARLRERLRHLDEAIPTPTRPTLGLTATAPAPRRRPRRLIVILAAAALLTAASAVTASRFLFPDEPQPALEAALAEVFAETGCLTARDARTAIRARLGALGLTDWQIESRPGAEEGPCVYAGYLTPQHLVLLFPYVGRDVVEAIGAVGDEMLERCMGRDEAFDLLSSVLASLGIRNFSIRTDGPQAAPIGKTEEYRQRIAAGCYLYSGSGSDAEGRPVYYLWGP